MKPVIDKNWRIRLRHFVPALAVAGLGLLLAVAAGLSLLRVMELRSEVDVARGELEVLSEELSRLKLLASGQLREIRAVTDRALPSEKPVFETLSSLVKVADENEVVVSKLESRPGLLATEAGRLRVVKSDDDGVIGGAEALEMTLTVNADFQGLSRFVGELTRLAPLMELVELRVRAGDVSEAEVSSENLFSGEIDLAVYWMRTDRVGVEGASVEELFGEESRELITKLLELRQVSEL